MDAILDSIVFSDGETAIILSAHPGLLLQSRADIRWNFVLLGSG
jgi:hypothetical protein